MMVDRCDSATNLGKKAFSLMGPNSDTTKKYIVARMLNFAV